MSTLHDQTNAASIAGGMKEPWGLSRKEHVHVPRRDAIEVASLHEPDYTESHGHKKGDSIEED